MIDCVRSRLHWRVSHFLVGFCLIVPRMDEKLDGLRTRHIVRSVESVGIISELPDSVFILLKYFFKC